MGTLLRIAIWLHNTPGNDAARMAHWLGGGGADADATAVADDDAAAFSPVETALLRFGGRLLVPRTNDDAAPLVSSEQCWLA